MQNGSGSNVTYTEYEYDGAGNLIKEKAANGQNVTSYLYDSQNRVTKMTDPMGMSETYSYDTAGNMVTKVDRNGTTLRYDYDGMNRLTKEYARVGNSEVLKSTYSYNGRNNLIKISNDNTSIEFYYGSENLLAYTYIYQNGKEYQINLVYDKGDNIFIKRLSQYVESKYFDEMKLTYIYAYDKNNKLLREEKYLPDDDRISITDYFYYNNGNTIAGNNSCLDTIDVNNNQSIQIKTASELSNNQMRAYFTYNVFNQLKEYRNTKGTKATYEYLPNNYRYSKTVGSTTIKFFGTVIMVQGNLTQAEI